MGKKLFIFALVVGFAGLGCWYWINKKIGEIEIDLDFTEKGIR